MQNKPEAAKTVPANAPKPAAAPKHDPLIKGGQKATDQEPLPLHGADAKKEPNATQPPLKGQSSEVSDDSCGKSKVPPPAKPIEKAPSPAHS